MDKIGAENLLIQTLIMFLKLEVFLGFEDLFEKINKYRFYSHSIGNFQKNNKHEKLKNLENSL